jgi:hypothetical protein
MNNSLRRAFRHLAAQPFPIFQPRFQGDQLMPALAGEPHKMDTGKAISACD